MNLTMQDFDQNDISVPNGNYFALPATPQDSRIVILSVPWDVTTSYGDGSKDAPDAIIEASGQVDLFDFDYDDTLLDGIGTLPINEDIIEKSSLYRKEACRVIQHLEEGGDKNDDNLKRRLSKINAASAELNEYVYNTAKKWIEAGKIVALVGGDHSTPLGSIRAVAEAYNGVGIIHIDAHADLRDAYEGFIYSHASIMFNVLKEIPDVSKIVQVGLRDICSNEVDIIRTNSRVDASFDHDIQHRIFEGENWGAICDEIVSKLPQKVYVSLDIDGLSPDNCPSTGTPVPGGLSFLQTVHLLRKIVETGRAIVGFDLVEVAPSGAEGDQWDANVGARMLYKLCNLTLKSNK